MSDAIVALCQMNVTFAEFFSPLSAICCRVVNLLADRLTGGATPADVAAEAPWGGNASQITVYHFKSN